MDSQDLSGPININEILDHLIGQFSTLATQKHIEYLLGNIVAQNPHDPMSELEARMEEVEINKIFEGPAPEEFDMLVDEPLLGSAEGRSTSIGNEGFNGDLIQEAATGHSISNETDNQVDDDLTDQDPVPVQFAAIHLGTRWYSLSHTPVHVLRLPGASAAEQRPEKTREHICTIERLLDEPGIDISTIIGKFYMLIDIIHKTTGHADYLIHFPVKCPYFIRVVHKPEYGGDLWRQYSEAMVLIRVKKQSVILHSTRLPDIYRCTAHTLFCFEHELNFQYFKAPIRIQNAEVYEINKPSLAQKYSLQHRFGKLASLVEPIPEEYEDNIRTVSVLNPLRQTSELRATQKKLANTINTATTISISTPSTVGPTQLVPRSNELPAERRSKRKTTPKAQTYEFDPRSNDFFLPKGQGATNSQNIKTELMEATGISKFKMEAEELNYQQSAMSFDFGNFAIKQEQEQLPLLPHTGYLLDQQGNLQMVYIGPPEPKHEEVTVKQETPPIEHVVDEDGGLRFQIPHNHNVTSTPVVPVKMEAHDISYNSAAALGSYPMIRPSFPVKIENHQMPVQSINLENQQVPTQSATLDDLRAIKSKQISRNRNRKSTAAVKREVKQEIEGDWEEGSNLYVAIMGEMRVQKANQKANGIVERFHCPIPGCEANYKTTNGIKYHAKVEHSRKGDLGVCDCGEAFLTQLGFLNHTSKCTKESPITECVCGRSFKTTQGYARHKKTCRAKAPAVKLEA